MTAIEGKMLTCDVCGKSIFLKFVGEKETDGGYTKWREYENAEGWSSVYVGKIGLGNVCPKCFELIEKSLTEIINGIRS